jgi:hypothetical protein
MRRCWESRVRQAEKKRWATGRRHDDDALRLPTRPN